MTLYWKSLDDFLAMGGYGPYVWGSFGVVALAVVIELFALRQRRKTLMSLISEGDEP
jgi:heme exporter protein D